MEKIPHSLEGSTLTTRQKKAELSENDKVFVEGVSTNTSKDCLQFYMERISDLDVKNITYGTKSSGSVNAIVTFHGPVGELRNDLEKKSVTAIQWLVMVLTGRL